MAIGRGETVGEAYIRIHADGSTLPQEIKDGFDDPSVGEAYRNAGKTHSKEEQEAYRAEQKRQRKITQKDVISSIRKDRGKEQALEEFLAGTRARKIRERLRTELSRNGQTGGKELADRIFTDLEQQARRRGDAGVFRQLMNPRALRALLVNAAADIKRDQDKIARDRQRLIDTVQAAERAAYVEDADRTQRLYRQKEQTYIKLMRLDRERNRINAGIFAGDSYHNRQYALQDRARFNAEYAFARQRAEQTHDYSELNTLLRNRNRILNDYNTKLIRGNGLLRGGRRETTELERGINRLSDRIEKGFLSKLDNDSRRGNIFTRAIRAATLGLLRFAATKTLNGIKEIGRGFGNVMGILTGDGTRGSKALKLLDLGFTSAAGGARKLVTSIAKTGALLVVLKTLIGPLVSIISMLGGGIAALSATIVNGLIFSVAQLLPLLPVLLTGVGVLALAFAGLSKDQKAALKLKFAPLRDEIQGLRKAAQGGILSDLPHQVKLLQPVLTSLKPLVAGTAKAISGVATSFIKGLSGSAFQSDLKVFNKFIPDTVTRLGHVFSNLFVGLAGYFRILSPYTTRFVKGLEASSKNFSKFTHSADGANKITRFMDTARKSADQLKLTLKLSYRVLRDLFYAGEPTGDSLFVALNKNLDKFDKYLRNPDNKQAIDGYFQDVRKFFTAAGNFGGGLARLFGALDDGVSRSTANGLLNIIGGASDLLGDAMPLISAFQKALIDTLKDLGGPLTQLFRDMRPIVRDLADSVGDFTIIAARVAADVLKPIIQTLDLVAKFISAHKDIFRPLILGLIGLKIAFALQSLGSALLVPLNNAIIGVQNLANRGATNIRSSAQRLGTAVAGLALAFGAIQGGNAIGGAKGKALSIFGGAAGGALAGSVFGPEGAAIGALAGGITGLISSLGHHGDAAKTSAEKARAALQAEKDVVDGIKNSLIATNGLYDANFKRSVAADLNKSGALTTANNAGIDTSQVVGSALGDTAAMNRLTTAYKNLAAATGVSSSGSGGGFSNLNVTPQQIKQIEAYEAIFKALGLEVPRVGKATKDFVAEQRAVGGGLVSLKQLQGGYKNLGKELHGVSVANDGYGVKNREVLRENLDYIGKEALARFKQGQSLDTVKAKYDTQVGAIKRTLTQLGYSKRDIADVITKYGQMPKEVSTAIKARDQATATTNFIKTGLKTVPKLVQARINAADSASAKVKIIKDYIKSVTGKTVTLGVDITDAINHITRVKNSLGNVTSVNYGGRVSGVTATAIGGTFNGAQVRLIAEAGPEAVVPLNRPLSKVDPSVRALSAFAQGLPFPGGAPRMASGGVVGGRSINVAAGAITVVTQSKNPEAVAQEMLNRLIQSAALG